MLCPRKLLAGLLLVGCLWPVHVFALAPPAPADSRPALYLQVDRALGRVEALGLPELDLQTATARRSLERLREQCNSAEVRECQRSLALLFDGVRGARRSADVFLAAALGQAATHLGDAVVRLGQLDASQCRLPTEMGAAMPARFLLTPDARHAEVQPLMPLRGGRRYALVREGPSPLSLSAVDPAAARRMASPAMATLEVERVQRLLKRAADAGARLDIGSFVGVRVALPEAARGEDLRGLRLSFVPLRRAERSSRGTIVASFRTADVRAGLLAYRRMLHEFSCSPTELVGVSSGGEASAAVAAFSGSYTSLDIRTDAAAADALGTLKPAPMRHEFRLLLPTEVRDSTPLVLVVDGHMGSMARMLARHGDELVTQGVAVLAIDIPEHGTRAQPGVDIVTPFDPARLSRNLRQAATDVMAIIRQAGECGFRAPDGLVYRPTELRYLGYSLGAMVGVIARAIESDLGAMALLAPGGDLIGWLMLRLGPGLGGRFVACVGGPDHGGDCVADGVCAAPGSCVADPVFEELYRLVEPAYSQASAPGDPLSFATERTGAASTAKLLLITGGQDAALHPALAARLADAFGMHPTGPWERRGPNSLFVQWPALAHDLPEYAGPRHQAHEFVVSGGRRVRRVAAGEVPPQPAWYSIFEKDRNRR
ncbi:MAG: hypothetical protein VCC00_09150 [Deltaproteobacteria bacterium]